jgi:hypothetical protein
MAGSKYRVRPLTQDDYDHWDDLIERAERGTVFHSVSWLRSFDRNLAVVGCYNEAGTLIGGIPLSYQRVAGMTMVRPPFLTPYLGPVVFGKNEGKYHRALTVERDVIVALLNWITRFASFIRIPLSPNHYDVQPFRQMGFHHVDIESTYVVRLDEMDRVWEEMDQDKRRKIKKAHEEGLSCEVSDDLDEFFPLWDHSLRSHNKRPAPVRSREVRRWYEALTTRNRTKILQIKDPKGRIHAGAILVWDQKRAYYLLSGMNRDMASHNAMALLLWECMRFCHEVNHLAEFDFDGSDIPSVEAFFRGFGGHLVPRYMLTYERSFLLGSVRSTWKRISALRRG